MKKTLLLSFVAIMLASSICVATNASANFSFDELKMVGSFESIVEKNEFGINETPWLYMKLPEGSTLASILGNTNFGASFWQAPDSTEYLGLAGTNGMTYQRENWISLASWNSIPDNDKNGVWGVDAFFVGTSGIGHGSTSFTVNPEPISVVLFMVGGLPIAANLYRKRKNTVKV